MTAREDALLDAIRAAPDDDAPRLVWADHVGGERGELVVVQCDLARGGLTPAEAGARRRRERALLAQHAAAWAGLGDRVSDYQFRRGFVEALGVDATRLADHATEILAAAPLVRSLYVLGLEGSTGFARGPLGQGDVTEPRTRALLATLARYPAIDRLAFGDARLKWLDVDPFLGAIQDEGYAGRADVVAQLLVGTGTLGRLRALGLAGCGLTATGAHALVESCQLDALEVLALEDTVIYCADVDTLVRACPRLRALDGDASAVLEGRLGALEALSVRAFHRATLEELAASPCAASLRHLRLANGVLDDGVDALARLPRLARLELDTAQFGHTARPSASQPAAARLATLELPALRTLRITGPVWPDDLVAIARAFGAQLELLHVAPSTDAATLARLEPLVAGAVVAGEAPPRYL